MGVTQLWSVVQPCGRPIKIETLNKKRLAVDASIWIYQFLKAVRDKDGNALRNSHVVGFFRRICKLLFIGIKPVFVFDGGAPTLKRQTISNRKARREGRREDAVRTAGKLLALQMQRLAEDEDQRRRNEATRSKDSDEEAVPENPVYVDELTMTAQERQQNRTFRKKDQYHLPDLEMSFAEMGQPNDPRVMSLEELEHYARQFDTGEDINIYDFSKINFDSPFFQSLPATDRYNILNAARLRSRLRMGYSKDQLEVMFPDRMAFSRFQIDRVKERNELTQRLMHLSGMVDDSMFGVDGSRIAGEKGREYVLVKNAGVEGGWALGVIGERDQGAREKPIDVDQIGVKKDEEDSDEDSDEDMEFDDVPIEGLNRLPKLKKQPQPRGKTTTTDILRRREAVYKARQAEASGSRPSAPRRAVPKPKETDSLFVQEESGPANGHIETGDEGYEDDEEELQRAIAMSLGKDDRQSSPDDDIFEDALQVDIVEANGDASKDISNQGGGFLGEEDDDDMNLQDALAGPTLGKPQKNKTESSQKELNVVAKEAQKFDGPLPFEKLDLGSSILGKKKMKKIEEDNAGGFEKEDDEAKSKKSIPLPPWFSAGADVEKDVIEQKKVDMVERERERREDAESGFAFIEKPRLRQYDTNEVIDVDAVDEQKPISKRIISIDFSDDEEMGTEDGPDADQQTEEITVAAEALSSDKTVPRMDDLAEVARAQPPTNNLADNTDARQPAEKAAEEQAKSTKVTEPGNQRTTIQIDKPQQQEENESEEEIYDWEESDYEKETSPSIKPVGGPLKTQPSKSPSPDFEDVQMNEDTNGISPHLATSNQDINQPAQEEPEQDLDAVADDDIAQPIAQPLNSSDEEIYSGESDEELLIQMANEAEEHVRFASSLAHSSKPSPSKSKSTQDATTKQGIEIYESELKALRSQQKKDRRDADEVTQVMIQECQQLLKLFGLPYITAPMEAEAQCAELVHLGIVDGIVTDDSDVFLFGGTRIYKNMFNQAKFVECYLTSDLEREFDLTREKMIRIAHLLGSDYTEGIPGIGPVTALEIISEFPTGLQSFKDWWARVQMGPAARQTTTEEEQEEEEDTAFKRKFRKNSTRLFLPPAFPDVRVDHAYLHPEVDSDPSPFIWGVPDLDALRSYLMTTIGWSQERTDEILVPVVRDMNRRENEGTQANITNFLGGAGGSRSVGTGTVAPVSGFRAGGGGGEGRGGGGEGAFAPRRRDNPVGKSKRMEKALEKLAERARWKRRQEAAGAGAGADDGGSGSTTAAGSSKRGVSGTETVSMNTGNAATKTNATAKGTMGSKSKPKAKPKTRTKRKGARTNDSDADDDDDDNDDEDNLNGNDGSNTGDDEARSTDAEKHNNKKRKTRRKDTEKSIPAQSLSKRKKRI